MTLLDIRWQLGRSDGYEQYRDGHIPGAIYVDLDAQLAAPAGPQGRHPLPPLELFAQAMGPAGVSMEIPVICYDDLSLLSAARCWWLLRHTGHRAAYLLDGALAGWKRIGGVVTNELPHPSPTTYIPQTPRDELITIENVAQFAKENCLLDARATDRYRGEPTSIDPVKGHIPGALSAPTMGNLNEDGTFLSPDQLRERFASLGISPKTAVGVYCGSGVTAAHQIFALEQAGISADLYPGSWSEWICDPQRPVAMGPTP